MLGITGLHGNRRSLNSPPLSLLPAFVGLPALNEREPVGPRSQTLESSPPRSLARGSVVVVASWSRRNIGFPCFCDALMVWRNGGEMSLEPKLQMRDPCVHLCEIVKLWRMSWFWWTHPQISRILSQWNPSPPSQEFSVLDIVVFWKLTNPPPPPQERERDWNTLILGKRTRRRRRRCHPFGDLRREFEKVSKLWTFTLNSSCFLSQGGAPLDLHFVHCSWWSGTHLQTSSTGRWRRSCGWWWWWCQVEETI